MNLQWDPECEPKCEPWIWALPNVNNKFEPQIYCDHQMWAPDVSLKYDPKFWASNVSLQIWAINPNPSCEPQMWAPKCEQQWAPII